MRYRGLTGALLFGVFLFAIVAVLGGIGAAVLYWFTSDPHVSLNMAGRIVTFGGTLCVTAAICRWLAGGETDRLLTTKSVRGDFAVIGAIVGVVVAGMITPLPASFAQTETTRAQIGAPFALAGPTLDGGQFDIVQHRGSVVLVDFWATWCGPCIKELPNVQATFDKYKDSGFKVVGVSLDFTKAELMAYVQKHPHPWPQIYFDEEGKRGFDNPLAKKYKLDGIPYLAVVDRNGMVAASDVRGSDIELAVGRALAGQSTAPSTPLFLLPVRVLFSPAGTLALCIGIGALIALALELLVRKLFALASATPRQPPAPTTFPR